MIVTPRVRVLEDAEQLALEAAAEIIDSACLAVSQRGHFHCALAGGETPKRTYRSLASPALLEKFPWDCFDAWLGDERIVPGDDPASNQRMAREHLFRPAGANPTALHAFDTESGDPHAAACAYARQLEETLPKNADDVPVLDLVLLGLGSDAHTASWFPGSSFSGEQWVAAVDEEHGGYRRLTLTPAAVNAARRILFLVSGATKRDALRRVFDERKEPAAVPAQRVAPTNGQVLWMLDRDAAGQFFAS